MKKLTALILFSILAVMSSRATLVWYEGFQYANGEITNTCVPTNTWILANAGDCYVINSNLQVTGRGTLISRAASISRFIATTSNSPLTNSVQLIYASFTIICTNFSNPTTNGAGLPTGPGHYFGGFYRNQSSSGGFCGRMQAFTNFTKTPGTWRLGVTDNVLSTNAGDGGFPVDLAQNTAYQVVEELDPITLQAATIWVNPININQTGANPVDPSYTASDGMGFATAHQVDSYFFRQPSGSGNWFALITNLCIATTFAEAMTNVWSTNAMNPVVVNQPVGITNFPGSSFNVSVVANGQGLASLTYQWRTNGVNYPNPNGNSPVLAFNSMPSTFGTNNVDVIVTTPYGLSVISSAAGVAIDDTPTAPIFVSQPPTNQVLFRSGNMVLTATVISPGTPSYTWYSNNVVVSATSGSTYSSTFEIDNLTTNNSATYRVAVTNNVYPTGIVSSNFVVTVQNPAAVSIEYLHQLVDHTTWQPTNVPPTIAYECVGHVTTLTNITTGNTASYYLQDGTAGINIFVTGGSTFRPQLGDVVDFVGVLSSFTSGIELYADTQPPGVTQFPQTSMTVLSNDIAGLPAPQPVSFSITNNVPNLNTNLGGRYVQISDVYFGTRAGTTNSTTVNDWLLVTNSAGARFTILFPDLDLDVAGRTNPAYAYDINGQIYSTNGLATNILLVTRWSDVVTNPPGISITCPGNITVTSAVPTNISFVVTASGGCTTPTVTSVPASGSAFSVGTTTVNSTATDGCHETNTCSFTVTVVSPGLVPTNSPHINSFSLSGANAVINGTNGQTTGIYYLLASTNMGSPLSLWKVVATNIVNTNGPNGAFTFTGTNVVTPGGKNQFYILSNTNSNH